MKTLTMAGAVAEAQAEEMERDESVFVLGEDVGIMGGAFDATAGLYEKFGADRVMDTPVSEAGIVGAAIGAALAGMRPVAEVQYIEFLGYIDPLINHMAKIPYMSGGKIHLPVVVRLPNGGKLGNAAPHSQYLESWFMHTPGIVVAMPSNPADAKGLLKTAIRDDNPVVFIEDKLLYFRAAPVPEEDITIPFGSAAIAREGSDATIVAVGHAVVRAKSAAQELSKRGIEVEIIDPRTLNPLDMNTIVESVKKTGHALIVYLACRTGGVGAEISARIVEEAFDYLDAPVARLAGLDSPIPYNLKQEIHSTPSVEEIVSAGTELLGEE